ncbi:MAG: short-chain dehydrogenase [Verrucomicrobia bacterium]|nr:MAG: short-chain dehydrogenase [Verrucomicrobiota bacterium]
MRLRNKVAVVTGSGSGIGKAIALLFGQEGARVIVNGRRAAKVSETVEAIRNAGGHAVGIAADISNADGAYLLMAGCLEAFGSVDVLVNNAGAVISRTTLVDCTEAEWNITMNANLNTAFLCSKHFLPELVKTRGNIIHISSVFGLLGTPNSAAYTASKAGLVGLTRAMAVDFGATGVRVNAICPAYIETDLNKEMLDTLRQKGKINTILERLPMRRLGDPADVAFAALYLASDEARWVTGIALPIDGGMSAGRT